MDHIDRSASEIVFQRNGKILVTPGGRRPEIAAAVRLVAQLETIVAGSYLFVLSPVAVWGSAARGIEAAELLQRLERYASTPIPAPIASRILELHHRYGAIWIDRDAEEQWVIRARDATTLDGLGVGVTADQVLSSQEVTRLRRDAAARGWPIIERGRAMETRSLSVDLRADTELRPYQQEAVEAHCAAGSGLVLLPCGAGKTMVGVGVLSAAATSTLIVTPSREIARQWYETILDHTTLAPDEVSTSPVRTISPVTITTYQAATTGRIAPALQTEPWGLVIFDEVQSLPADVFRRVSGIGADRRLGLSATLVREDGREAEVFAMVGPVVYDVPWIELEHEGWIAPARCYEVRIPKAPSATERARYKHAVIERILGANPDRPTLVVGTAVPALERAARQFGLPLLTGRDNQERRTEVFDAFRSGEIRRLAISRIGSVGLDLPDTQIAIQLNGNFGSRQEEAQRLGRLLRPGNGETVHFYSLVSEGTREPEYARRRQRFLVDQGYEYEILDAADIPRVN